MKKFRVRATFERQVDYEVEARTKKEAEEKLKMELEELFEDETVNTKVISDSQYKKETEEIREEILGYKVQYT